MGALLAFAGTSFYLNEMSSRRRVFGMIGSRFSKYHSDCGAQNRRLGSRTGAERSIRRLSR